MPIVRRPRLGTQVKKVRRPHSIRMARTDDFRVARWEPRDVVPDDAPWIPYAFDLEAERLWLTDVGNVDSLLAAPFFYQAQYRQATQVLSCPVERVGMLVPAAGFDPARLIFVFSIGRCGSTLLSALLRARSIISVSEPDSLYQLSGLIRPLTRQFGPAGWTSLLHHSVGLSHGLAERATGFSGEVAIKLRSQSNNIARLVAREFAASQFVFILRDLRSWFVSCARAFGRTPEQSARIIAGAVNAIHDLRRSGASLTIIWYEELVADPASVIGRFHSVSPAAGGRNDPQYDDAALKRVMEIDAQQGSGIDRASLRDRQVDDREIARFLELVAPHSDVLSGLEASRRMSAVSDG